MAKLNKQQQGENLYEKNQWSEYFDPDKKSAGNYVRVCVCPVNS